MGLRDVILAADDIESEMVEVRQWNVKVEVRSLTARERARMLDAIASDNPEEFQLSVEKLYPDIVIKTCYDPETGERLFQDEDREELMNKSGAAVEKLAQAGIRLSGMDAGAENRLGKASSTPTPNEDSISS